LFYIYNQTIYVSGIYLKIWRALSRRPESGELAPSNMNFNISGHCMFSCSSVRKQRIWISNFYNKTKRNAKRCPLCLRTQYEFEFFLFVVFWVFNWWNFVERQFLILCSEVTLQSEVQRKTFHNHNLCLGWVGWFYGS
jgi:hypothetical protein